MRGGSGSDETFAQCIHTLNSRWLAIRLLNAEELRVEHRRTSKGVLAAGGHLMTMQISAKVDYGIRAVLTLVERGQPMTVGALAEAQSLPSKYLGAILNDLRRAEIVSSRRGGGRGYRLSRPASEISVAEVMRALEGPLAEVNGTRPEAATYRGAARHLQELWLAVIGSLEDLVEVVTLDDLVQGRIPSRAAQDTRRHDRNVAQRSPS